jgi:hypothetical protein
VANEAPRELLVDLARNPADQIVVVEKPFGGLRERGAPGVGRGEVLLRALECERDR